MKQHSWIVMMALLLGLCVPSILAQSTGSVKGTCKDADGKPIVGAVVEYFNPDTGRKYTLKTNNHGEYFSLGIEFGPKYTVTLTKDGQVLDKANGVRVGTDENVMDFDLKKSQEQTAAQHGMTAEQMKKMEEQQTKAKQENMTISKLNEQLATANQQTQAGDLDGAIATLTQTTQMDPTRDLIWAHLGDAYINSAAKQTDSAEKTKRYGEAVDAYQKAVDLKSKTMETAPKTPEATKSLAQYYNNLGQANAKSGKTDDAVKAYNQAAQLDPAAAGQYYFNLGAILTNSGNVDGALQAFDKAIAADPNKADAYYWKGVNMIGKATLKDDKMVAPDGTAEAFNKYLELQPTGTYAEPAKQMLASIGATVETNFGKKKTTGKK